MLMPLSPSKILARREKLELTQTQAADRAGMAFQHWSRMEHGDRPDPKLSSVERIAGALGCKITDLLD